MLHQLIEIIRQRHRIRQRRRESDRLSNHPVMRVREVHAAIGQVNTSTFSEVECQWMAKVEALRDRVVADKDRTVTSTDFGAGQPDESRPNSVSLNGIQYTTTLSQICQTGNVSSKDRQLLLALVRHCRPSRALEMGTSLGFSAAYQAAAFKLNGRGYLVTLDGAAELVQIARTHLAVLGLTESCRFVVGRFCDTLDSVLKSDEPFDLAFVDGHHNGVATLAYFQQMLPYLAEHAVVVFDDIHWYDSMKAAWSELKQSKDLLATFELDALGIGIVSKERSGPIETLRL